MWVRNEVGGKLERDQTIHVQQPQAVRDQHFLDQTLRGARAERNPHSFCLGAIEMQMSNEMLAQFFRSVVDKRYSGFHHEDVHGSGLDPVARVNRRHPTTWD